MAASVEQNETVLDQVATSARSLLTEARVMHDVAFRVERQDEFSRGIRFKRVITEVIEIPVLVTYRDLLDSVGSHAHYVAVNTSNEERRTAVLAALEVLTAEKSLKAVDALVQILPLAKTKAIRQKRDVILRRLARVAEAMRVIIHRSYRGHEQREYYSDVLFWRHAGMLNQLRTQVARAEEAKTDSVPVAKRRGV